jgi:hypothetical protein
MNISKNFVLLCSFFVLHFYFNFAATAQEWQWAKGLYRLPKNNGVGNSYIIGAATTTDQEGNVYVAFNASDSLQIETQKLKVSSGYGSCFIVKYNTDGSLVWVRELKIITGNFSIVSKIHCDVENNIYVTGHIEGVADLGGISIQGLGGFVAKYSSSGVCQWAKVADSYINFFSSGIDKENNLIIIGVTKMSFILGTVTYNVSPQNTENTFITKITKEGTVLWIKKLADYPLSENNVINGFANIKLDFDSSNNILFYASWYNQINIFDETIIANDANTNSSFDVLLLKMDKNTNKIWSKKIVSSSYDYAQGLAIDKQDNIYLVGTSYGSNRKIDSTSLAQEYILKLSPNSNVIWHRSVSNNKYSERKNIYDFKISSNGKLYLIIDYTNNDKLDNLTLPPAIPYIELIYFLNMVVAQMNTDGKYEWANTWYFNSSLLIQPYHQAYLTTDNYSNVYVCSAFYQAVLIGTTPLIGKPVYHHFIAKLSPCSSTISITSSPATPCGSLLKTFECINCTYQWFRNGQPIANATQANYTATENGDYQVVARNTTCAAINSNTLQVEIGTLIPAVILGKDKRLLCGKTDTLQVQTIQGASYQWFRNNEKIAANLGGNQAFLPISLSGEYKVTVSKPNICPNTSQIVTVKFQNLTAKIKGDSLQKTCEKAILRADVADTTAYKYKWTHNGITLSTTQATLHTSISGVYQLQLQQDSCFAISPTISLQILTKPVAKIIENTNNMLGNTLNFCETGVIHSEIAENITYQWLWNRIKVGNLANLVIKQSGNYQLVASNGVCTDTSQILKINIIPSPTAKIEQKNPTFFCTKGILTALQDENNNNPNFEKPVYSWFRNTTQNPQNPTLELVGTGTTLNVNTSGRYQLQVSRQNCSTTSETIEVILNKAEASIIQNLQNLPTANNPLLFCESGILEAVIFPNTSYEWFFDNRSISKNATTIATTSGIYQLKASQEFCVDSAIIYVEVQKFPENPTLKVSNTQFCKEHKVFLEAVAIPDAKYRWQWNGQKLPDSIANNPNNGITQVLNGSTVSSINSSGKLETNLVGNYQVFAIRKNGCEKLIGNTVLTNIASTEIKILANKQTFALNTMLIFPNPSQKNISLQTLIKPAISLEISANTAQNSTLIWQSSQWFLNGKVVPEFDNLSKITPTEEGNYQFFGIDAKGCKTTTTSTKVMFDRIKNMEISIFDALGRLVFQHHLDTVVVGATVELPIENLSMGLYLLKISTDKGEKWSKILKE